MMDFNWAAGIYIFSHPSRQKRRNPVALSGALKPVWLEQVRPELVFVGSSRIRDGFDPTLIDPALHVEKFQLWRLQHHPL